MRLFWKQLLSVPLTFLIWPVEGVLSQEIRPDRFRYERTIIPGSRGPNRLAVDVALLSGAVPFSHLAGKAADGERTPIKIARGGLSDLRIYDASNREIPYLLVEPPAPDAKWLAGRLLAIASTKKTSGFEIDLGRPFLVDRLNLGGLIPSFLKRFRLEGSGDRSRWTLLVPEGTLFDLPSEGLRHLEVEFEAGEYRYLRLIWDDSSSARVAIPGSAAARLVNVGAPAPPLKVPLTFERRTSEPGVSRYRLRLPAPRLPVVAVELASSGENVLRRALITEGRLSDGHVLPHELGSAVLRRTTRGALAADAMRILIAGPTEAQLELSIADGNNPPLEISSISAVLAYLPWIYFESPGTDPLKAFFGYDNLASPQYDLEAMRGSIDGVHTVESRWGEMRRKPPAAEAEETAPTKIAGAPLDVTAFQFSREIPEAEPGLNALLLDAAVLAHSNMNDLRIVGPDGRQVPYLMETMDELLSVELPAPEKTEAPQKLPASPSSSYYRLKLPYEGLPASHLVLTTSARVFERHVFMLVERNAANDRQEPWTERLADVSWSHADPEAPAPELTMRLPSLYGEARLVVEEGDNSPLPITSAKLLLPSFRMRFFREAGKLTLYYGRSDLSAPHYDLALLAPRLVGAMAEEISLGPELGAGKAAGTAQLQMKYFWAVLIAAAAALFLLIGRLIRRGEPVE